MNIGIIGTGKVGSTLGSGLADRGHHVTLGSRDPSQERLKDWASKDSAQRHFDTRQNAVDAAELIIFAVPGRALEETVHEIGSQAFDDKIVIDATNPFGKDDEGRTIDVYGDDDSGAELLQRELQGARVVKAFNEINAPKMMHPEQEPSHTIEIAGDDASAKQVVTELLESLGWRVQDNGLLAKARELEHVMVDKYR